MMLHINQGAAVLTQLDDRSQSPIVKVVTPRGINFNLKKTKNKVRKTLKIALSSVNGELHS